MLDQNAINQHLQQLVHQFKLNLTSQQTAIILEFIEMAEWGLALETICDFLYEAEVPISDDSYKVIEQVGNSLLMNPDDWNLLERQVQSSSE